MTAATPRLEIWLADLEGLQPALEAAEKRIALLAPSERAWNAAPSSSNATRRLSRLALRVLLARWGVGEARGAEFATETRGKPKLRDHNAHFSVSHTRDHALIAIAGIGPIGIDLEGDRTIQLGTARLSLMIAAAGALANMTADQEDSIEFGDRSLRAWTALEAFGKARGSGIGALLTDIGITASGARALSRADTAARAAELMSATDLKVRHLHLPPGWHGAVAAPASLLEAAPAVHELMHEHCESI